MGLRVVAKDLFPVFNCYVSFRVKKPPSVIPIYLEPPPKEEGAPGAAEQT